MKRMLLILSMIFTFACGNAQRPATGIKIISPPVERILVADETEIIASGKTGFRVITVNDTIAKKLMQKFEDNGMTKFTYVQKKDRHGKYWERSFYFKNESWNAVTLYINTYLK